MITINAYGYNVTGNDKIISVIMDMMNDNEITINWNNFKITIYSGMVMKNIMLK